MKEARFGFPGHNVRITETIKNCYEVPYMDYVIMRALNELTDAEKFKIVRFMIRTFKKSYLFPEACYARKKSNIDTLLSNCKNDSERIKKPKPSFGSSLIIR